VESAAPSPLRRWWADTSRGLPQPFWYLLAGTFVNRLGQMVTPFLALYLVGPRDFSASTVGVVLACLGAGSFASQPVGGFLADRVGRRTTLVIGMVATAASFMLLAAVRDLVWIAVAAALSGLAVDMYRPAVSAMVADLVQPEHRPRAFALLYWAINLGVAVAGVTGGLLAERSYWLLFVVDAATCLAFAVLIARKVPETRPPRDPSHTGGFGRALRDRLLIGLSVSTLIGAAVYMQSLVTLPLAVAAAGLGPDAFGLIYAVNPLVVIVSQVFVLRIIDRIDGVRILVASLVVMGFGFWLTTFASSVPVFALTVVVWTLGEVGFNAVEPALVADIAPVHLRGRYNGVVGMAYGAAALVGPLIGTRLFEDFGEGVLWTSCLLASVVSAGLIAAMAPAIARRRVAMVLAGTPSEP
jgi:MFS family permease